MFPLRSARLRARPYLAGAMVLSGLALFAAGGAATWAVVPGGQHQRPATATNSSHDSARNGLQPGISVGTAGSGASVVPGGPMVPAPTASCTLPAGVVSDAVISPARAGMAPRLLGPGFSLASITVNAEGCPAANGKPATGSPVIASQWYHDASGLEVSVVQRASAKAIPDVIRGGSASFWSDGFSFQVDVGGVVYAAGTAGDGAAMGPDRAGKPASTSRQTLDVLRAAVAQLAPSVEDSCFYHQTTGGWEDLPKLGIGDPRPAIPPGFTGQLVQIETFAPPSATCNTARLDNTGRLSATWTREDSSAAGGPAAYISIGVSPVSGELAGKQGYLSDRSASWSNGTYLFSVNVDSSSPAIDLVKAIATALDPKLDVSTVGTALPPVRTLPAPASPPVTSR